MRGERARRNRRMRGNGRRVMAAILIASATDVALAEGTAVLSSTTPSPRLYDVATETGMPHLEESLRYAVVRQRRCLDPRDLSRAFWMLDDVSLQDCRLEKTAQDDESARYDLRCDGGHGTTGSARWQIGAAWLRGTLDVRLGGKNMTFYQRVVAQAVPGDQLERERPHRDGQIGAASVTCSAR